MNHKKFGKLLTEISKMTKKHFSPSQVIALTEKFSDPVVVKHDVIEVKNKKDLIKTEIVLLFTIACLANLRRS